jgi:hypothetical protein
MPVIDGKTTLVRLEEVTAEAVTVNPPVAAVGA